MRIKTVHLIQEAPWMGEVHDETNDEIHIGSILEIMGEDFVVVAMSADEKHLLMMKGADTPIPEFTPRIVPVSFDSVLKTVRVSLLGPLPPSIPDGWRVGVQKIKAVGPNASEVSLGFFWKEDISLDQRNHG